MNERGITSRYSGRVMSEREGGQEVGREKDQ